jgi:magnesium-transporting ATPase (P-type)
MHKIKVLLIAVGLLAGFSLAVTPGFAAAQTLSQELRCGSNAGASGTDKNGNGCAEAPADRPSLNEIIARVINILSSLAAVIAVIMIIVAGLRYITSAGDSTKAASARNTILNAVIGLVIAVFAQVIVRFVLHSV